MKIDWKRKLTSRKWWMAVAGMVTGIVMIFWGETTAKVIGGVIMDVASVIGYTIGEGMADANHVEPEVVVMGDSEVATLEELAAKK